VKTGIIVLALAFATACSTNPSSGGATAKTAQADDPEKGIICTYEKPTGSFLKEKKCTTPEQREAARNQRETLMDVRNERDSGL
jgi:hypothetical protein